MLNTSKQIQNKLAKLRRCLSRVIFGSKKWEKGWKKAYSIQRFPRIRSFIWPKLLLVHSVVKSLYCRNEHFYSALNWLYPKKFLSDVNWDTDWVNSGSLERSTSGGLHHRPTSSLQIHHPPYQGLVEILLTCVDSFTNFSCVFHHHHDQRRSVSLIRHSISVLSPLHRPPAYTYTALCLLYTTDYWLYSVQSVVSSRLYHTSDHCCLLPIS